MLAVTCACASAVQLECTLHCAGGIVADDWCTINWQKIQYLITCGLRPWYLDNTTPAAAMSDNSCQQPSPNLSSNLTQAAHLPPNPHQPPQLSPNPNNPTQPSQLTQQQPAGQQQAWQTPQHLQQAQPQLWQAASGSGSLSDGAFLAVVSTGQPWQAGPGTWQCDVNIVVKNTGAYAAG